MGMRIGLLSLQKMKDVLNISQTDASLSGIHSRYRSRILAPLEGPRHLRTLRKERNFVIQVSVMNAL